MMPKHISFTKGFFSLKIWILDFQKVEADENFVVVVWLKHTNYVESSVEDDDGAGFRDVDEKDEEGEEEEL